MIFMDYKAFANNNEISEALNESYNYTVARFQNAIFDEVHMRESVDIVYNPTKDDWDFTTVFLWDCTSIEAGNIALEGLPINKLVVRRRKKEDFIFEDVHSFDFDSNIQFYEYRDRFIESWEDYVYGIQPMAGSEESAILGETTAAEISTSFEGVWIVGKDVQYKLMFDLEVGAYESTMPSQVVETMGSMYPVVVANGDVNYRKGNLTCRLVSDATWNTGLIDPKQEKQLRRAITTFLRDRKPKFFKESSGESMLISIVGNPTLQPANELGQSIYNISIEFVEVGDASFESLKTAGLVV